MNGDLPPIAGEILRRVIHGDLADESQAALDADLDADPLLGGHDTDDL